MPTTPDDPAAAANRAAWETLRRFDTPVPVHVQRPGPDHWARGDGVFKREVPGTNGQPHVTIEGGGHFLQEDCGPVLAGVLVDFIGRADQLAAATSVRSSPAGDAGRSSTTVATRDGLGSSAVSAWPA